MDKEFHQENDINVEELLNDGMDEINIMGAEQYEEYEKQMRNEEEKREKDDEKEMASNEEKKEEDEKEERREKGDSSSKQDYEKDIGNEEEKRKRKDCLGEDEDSIIEAIILTGPAAGELAYIPRIPMIPTDLPFQFKRQQFPIKVSFAITINKSQGQTFKYVGIDLRGECFSHGQLYVGLSRTGNAENQYILLPANRKTKNIIYPEVL